jgi:4-amino-4-deoxy-L-arabinose transferase-like glycosyltransferase
MLARRSALAAPASPGQLAALLAVSLPFLFLGLGFDFLDPGEGLYGTIPGEMVAGGDWVYPHFNGLPYLEKPPLYFWLAAATLALGVPVEWAARLWSALPALGSVLLTWRLGTRLYGGDAGLLAGLALATTPGFALHARRASPDLLMVFCLTLAIYGFVRDLDRQSGPGRFLLLYLGVALGLLSKGLMGAIFPLIIVGLWLSWSGRPTWRELNLWRGAALAALVAVPWHVAVAWRNPEHFWFYVVDNQVLRFLSRRGFLEDDVPVSTLGFLIVTFLLAFPWSVFVLARRDRMKSRRQGSLPVLWAGVVIGFFALSGSTLEYYGLPAFPALALLAGAAWSARRDTGAWLALGAAGSALVGFWAVWAGGAMTSAQALRGLAELNVYYRILQQQGLSLPFPSPEPFGRLLQALGMALLLGWGMALLGWRRTRHGPFVALVAMAGGIALLIAQLLHLIEPHHSARPVAAAILRHAAAHELVVHEGSLEYSAALPLYAGRQVRLLEGRRGDLDFASRLPEARGLFLDRQAFVHGWLGTERVFLVTQRPASASAAAALPRGSVHDLGLYGSRRLLSNRPSRGRPWNAEAGTLDAPEPGDVAR